MPAQVGSGLAEFLLLMCMLTTTHLFWLHRLYRITLGWESRQLASTTSSVGAQLTVNVTPERRDRKESSYRTELKPVRFLWVSPRRQIMGCGRNRTRLPIVAYVKRATATFAITHITHSCGAPLIWGGPLLATNSHCSEYQIIAFLTYKMSFTCMFR